jgi:HSP20 family protein
MEPFRLMRREFESLFDRFFGAWPEPCETPIRTLETEEKEKEYLVRSELPGFEPSEIEVEVRGDILTVKAEHKEAKEGEGKKEARYAEFKRTVSLPPGTEGEKTEARYHNGILEIHLPKGPEAVGRRIEVKT